MNRRPVKYRKKPVVVEAHQVPTRPSRGEPLGSWLEEFLEIAAWCDALGHTMSEPQPYIEIETLEGTMRADVGDWIVQGVRGEFYPRTPDIFAATYEAVTLPRVLRWLRGPWVAPDPAPDLSWLDRKDGLDTRYCGAIQPSAEELADARTWAETRRDILARAAARADLHATLRAEGTRYDAVMDSGPEEPGGDLPLTNIQVLGRDRYAQCDETCTADCGHCKGRRFGPYAIPHPTRYDAQWPDVHAAEAGGWAGGDLAAMAAPWPGMARDALGTYAEPVKPRGRHRQTDPLDLILADLRDLDGV